MYQINKKTLYILSDGSSYYKNSAIYNSQNSFLFFEKDFISLNKKKSNKKIKLDSSSNYKNKYFNY
jgi:hypothetical protein